MKIKSVAKNQTELSITKKGIDYIILFSYETPVAVVKDWTGFKTITKYSSTTTKHINQFFSRNAISDIKTVPQHEIDNIIK